MHPDEAAAVFESHRVMLRGLAYRMLGSVAEAEDIVQETYLRWSEAEHDDIRSPRAWLVKVCSRLAIDALRSARIRREHYVGPWLPEPWIAIDEDRVAEQMELDDTVSMALLVVLEQVSPSERAAFLLHDVFDFDFEEVAQLLGKSSAACRKLASRARERIRVGQSRQAADAADHRRLTEAFFLAAREDDHEALMSIFHEDVVLHTDGGGKAQAARRIVRGANAVSRFFRGVFANPKADAHQYTTRFAWFNGAPGLLLYEDNQLVTAITLDVEDGTIRSVFAIRNPDKLKGFGDGDSGASTPV